jgi:hypothetical protein
VSWSGTARTTRTGRPWRARSSRTASGPRR